jgi:hypothetical protein
MRSAVTIIDASCERFDNMKQSDWRLVFAERHDFPALARYKARRRRLLVRPLITQQNYDPLKQRRITMIIISNIKIDEL